MEDIIKAHMEFFLIIFVSSFFRLSIFLIYFFEPTDISIFAREGQWEMNILRGWPYQI